MTGSRTTDEDEAGVSTSRSGLVRTLYIQLTIESIAPPPIAPADVSAAPYRARYQLRGRLPDIDIRAIYRVPPATPCYATAPPSHQQCPGGG